MKPVGGNISSSVYSDSWTRPIFYESWTNSFLDTVRLKLTRDLSHIVYTMGDQ